MDEQRPYHKFLFRDFLFGFAVAIPIALWVLLTIKVYFGITIKGLFDGATDFQALLLAIAGTVICSIVCLWRWNRIRSIFGRGVFVDALIIEGSSTRIHLQYIYQTTEFEKIISPPDRNHSFVTGQTIKIAIDPRNPKRMALAE